MDKLDEYVDLLIRSRQPDERIQLRVKYNIFLEAEEVDFFKTNKIFDNTFRIFAEIWDKQLAAL